VAAVGFSKPVQAGTLVGSERAWLPPKPYVQRTGGREKNDDAWLAIGRARPLTATAWVTGRLRENSRYRLAHVQTLDFLARYARPAVERAPEWQRFWTGRYGPPRSASAHPALSWSAIECELSPESSSDGQLSEWGGWQPELSGFLAPKLGLSFDAGSLELFAAGTQEATAVPEPEFLPLSASKNCPAWQRVPPVTIVRHGAEHDTFRLLECDGSIAADAIDRLSVLARPPGSPRPEIPLPLEPQIRNEFGEWLPEVKLSHPRLVWALQSIADAFPRRAIYIVSGYRRDGHGSFHRKARALDLFVTGVSNEDLFRYCRTLKDVGCGYYPNNSFVHIDVRPFGSGHPMWIDVSSPGTPSEYVDSWPGLAPAGSLPAEVAFDGLL
jgi:hypothetical protein